MDSDSRALFPNGNLALQGLEPDGDRGPTCVEPGHQVETKTAGNLHLLLIKFRA
jgi:hypothetical protein